MGEELQKPTLFWAAADSMDFKPLEVESVEGLESFDISKAEDHKPMEYSLSFDIELSKEQVKNFHRLFKMRIPRKLKKKYKKIYAKYFGIMASKVRLDVNYLMCHK